MIGIYLQTAATQQQLVVFVIYQAWDVFKPQKKKDLPIRMGPYFVIASILNGLWTFVFVKEWVGLSVVILLALTASVYILLWRLNVAMHQPPLRILLCVWWPLMIYAGWVTVASVVNVASWFESINVTINSVVAIIVLISLGVVLTLLLMARNVRELVIASAWGIAAVGVEQSDLVAVSAWTIAVLLILFSMVNAYFNRHYNLLRYITR